MVGKERVIRGGEEIKCRYEEVSDPDLCNFKVMKCLASEHKLTPAAARNTWLRVSQIGQPLFFYLDTQNEWWCYATCMPVVNSSI